MVEPDRQKVELAEGCAGGHLCGTWCPEATEAPGPWPGLGGQRAGDAGPVPSAAGPGHRLELVRGQLGPPRGSSCSQSWALVRTAENRRQLSYPKEVWRVSGLLPWQVWPESNVILRKIILASSLRILSIPSGFFLFFSPKLEETYYLYRGSWKTWLRVTFNPRSSLVTFAGCHCQFTPGFGGFVCTPGSSSPLRSLGPRFSEPLGLAVVPLVAIFLHGSVLREESEGRDLQPGHRLHQRHVAGTRSW